MSAHYTHQVVLSGERCRGEDVRGRLEVEVEETRERLRKKTEKLVSAEEPLLASRQQVHVYTCIIIYAVHHTYGSDNTVVAYARCGISLNKILLHFPLSCCLLGV